MGKSKILKIIDNNQEKFQRLMDAAANGGWRRQKRTSPAACYGYVKNQLFRENKILTPSLESLVGQNAETIAKFEQNYNYIHSQQSTFDYIIQTADKPIDLHQIIAIHNKLAENTSLSGGIIRNKPVGFMLNIEPPEPDRIYNKMENICWQLDNEIPGTHPADVAIQVHYDIIITQPFFDYNKRTARMVTNQYLIKKGYVPIFFNKPEDATEYFDALRNKNDEGGEQAYKDYMYYVIIRCQEKLIDVLSASI